MKVNKFKTAITNPRYILLFILHRLSHLIKSDKKYYTWQYRLITGRKLDIDHPVGYNEKLQWLKLYDRKPIYTTMVDKFAVKKYVSEKIGDQYVVPLLGVWDRPEDIDFESLPQRFVLKATHGGGGLDVVICKDKNKINKAQVTQKLKRSLNFDYWRMREWPYKNVPRKIIAEQYLEDKSGDLYDYKVMCFSGKPKFIQVHKGRFTHQTQDIYDVEWNKLNIFQSGYPVTDDYIERPVPLSEMLSLSSILAEGIPQVRVDWYIANGKLYFGELTFFDGAGFSFWEPEEWELKMGNLIVLPTKNVNNE